MLCDVYIIFELKLIICNFFSDDILLRVIYVILVVNVFLRDIIIFFNVIFCILWMVVVYFNFKGSCFLIIFLLCKLFLIGDILIECFGIVFVVVNLEICFFLD